jgi:hypothetical protein
MINDTQVRYTENMAKELDNKTRAEAREAPVEETQKIGQFPGVEWHGEHRYFFTAGTGEEI